MDLMASVHIEIQFPKHKIQFPKYLNTEIHAAAASHHPLLTHCADDSQLSQRAHRLCMHSETP